MATTPNKYLRENEEMRSHIAQLKRDLEQEKNAVKQAHRNKVAEVKSAREEEAARHRRELETQLDKVRRDARNEKQNMERTLKQQLQFELEQRQKAQEEEINALKENWSKEKNEILTAMKAKVQTEAMEEARKKFEVVRKQMTTEMFQMDSARNEAEEKANILAAADQEKAEELRKQAEIHRAELDRMRREAQQTDNQHRDEMKNKDRLLASKNKEIIMLGEKLSRTQSERDNLQETVQRYKQGDSFHKMTPKSPSIGIGDKSFEEVTAATITPKVYSEHEKELILKNGELSFRLKEVEKQNHMLKETKENLEHKVDQLKEASKPLEEKNKKLFQRCIEMQGAKQRQELRNNQLTSEIDELKARNGNLEKEVAQQRRRLTHLLGESGSSRGTLSTLKAQNERLKSDNKELHAKIQAGDRRYSELQLSLDRMRKQNYKFKQKISQLEKARLPVSPEPTNISLDSSLSHSDLAAVDEESHCSILQEELEQVTFDYAEMETNYGMLKREKLLLEKENGYLKQQLLGAGEYDTQREGAKVQQLQHERDEALNKLQKMEDELISIVDSDETNGSAKEAQKETAIPERETAKWHEVETKLVQTEASLTAAQEKVTQFTQREEQFLQQLQDISGELEHSREQHRAEIMTLREELSKQELQNAAVEDAESKIMKLQQELQQRVQENETVLQTSREKMAAKEQQHLVEVAQLKEAIKATENETTSTIEALHLKITELELSTAKANEQVFHLNKEKASVEVALQQQLAEVKEELDRVKDASIAEQESWKERYAKAQETDEIDGPAKESRTTVVGLEEQKLAITAELEESRLQLQQITTAMAERESSLAELTDKLSHSEQQLLNVRKILQEAPTLINQGNTAVTDSKTGRTINDVVRDLISEVDDGTLTLQISKQAQASQAHDAPVQNEEDQAHELKETISSMQLVLDQLNLEKDQVKREVSQLTLERDQLREGYNQLEQHIHQLSQERDQIRERYGQLEQQVIQIRQLKDTNDQIEQQIDHDQELDKIKGRKTELEQHVNQINQERAHLTERHNQLEQQIDQLNQSREQLKERHDELTKQVDQLNQQYTELKQANDELENLNNQLSEENNSLREQLKSYNEMTQKREAQFKEQLMEDSKVLVEMQQQLNHSQHSLSTSLHQADEKSSLLTTSQSKCQILESQLHESETRNRTLQKQHDKLHSENAKLQREVSEISVTLKEMSVSSQQKERELSILRSQVKQQHSEPILRSKMQSHVASNGAHKQRLFVALLDYHPQSFCRSGHPEKELQLQAGDVVNVIGDMNADGYYHVQFESRQGLVPAHFLEEMNIKNTTIKQRLRDQRLSNSSLTSNGDMYSDSTNTMQYQLSEDELHPPSQPVAPPTELRVERVLQRGLVISWTLPNITALGDSNGLKIQGYQVFIDGVLNSTVLGCYQSKALIGSINVDKPHSVAVATFALNGTLSNKCHIQYKPIHITHDHPNTLTGSSHSRHQPLQHSPHHQNYQLMKVVHTPASSDSQLRLQEGDIVKVFGRLRKDGNYVAEVHGDHVLIPGYLLVPVISGV